MSSNPFVAMEQFLVNSPDFQTAVTFQPSASNGGGAPQTINGVLMPIPDQFLEWVMPTQGANVVHLFVRWADITPTPQNGDFISISGFNYNVAKTPEVDEFGGAKLHLERYQ